MITKYDFIKNCISLQGIEIISSNVNAGTFQVFATSEHKFAVCPRCKVITQKVHDRRYQDIRHLKLWDLDTVITLEKKRYVCDCDLEHPFDEQFEFLRKHQRQTFAFEKQLFLMVHKNTIKNVSDFTGLGEGKCQRIYNHYATNLLDNREQEPLVFLGIDDVARRKGHNYNTVVYNQETGTVVTVFAGRTKEEVIKQLMKLPEHVRLGVKAVSMDMSRGYCSSVQECFPNAKPVIDRFHISQHLHRCVDDARKHIQNHIRKHEKKDAVFKIRWAMLKNVEDLKHHEALDLIYACSKYHELHRLHFLKEEFREFFKIETREKALAFLEYYNGLAEEFDIPEIKKFTKTIRNWLTYILNYYDYKITNGFTEGNNHKLKNIKRRGYGYRNNRNFEIRIKLEFECA